MVAENATLSGIGREARVSTPAHVSRVQESYSRWARLYDWFARATTGVGGVRDSCLSALDIGPGDTVVEFGCGPGVNLPALRDAVGRSGHVVGIDITGTMLGRAQSLVSRRGWENVSLVQADAARPPITAADAVLATFVTSLFPNPYAVVCEWCELAKSVTIANFAPRGNRAANAALWLLTQVNAELFDVGSGNALGQLDERTAASQRALESRMATFETAAYVFGTITVSAGHRES